VSVAYTNTLPAVRRLLCALQLPWSKPQLKNLRFLVAAFLAERSLPVRRLARALAGPRKAHRHWDKRLRRFLGSEKLDTQAALAALLAFLLPRFGAVPYLPVVLDWTWIGRTWVVLWAQIPYRGRSFPLFCLVLPAMRYGDTRSELELLTLLEQRWPLDGPRPLLLADGGFPKKALLTWLHDHDWRFLIRGKKNVHLYVNKDRQPLPLPASGLAPGRGEYYREVRDVSWKGVGAFPLHVVVSGRWFPEGPRSWVLLTNLPEPELAWTPLLYAHRMQPEQTHRDCKRGHFVSGFALAHLGRLRADRLARLLFCVGLIYVLLVLLAESEQETRAWLRRRHWGLSLVTFGLDLVRELGAKLEAAIKRALVCVKLEPLWLQTGDS
jgi:DDE family transposase